MAVYRVPTAARIPPSYVVIERDSRLFGIWSVVVTSCSSKFFRIVRFTPVRGSTCSEVRKPEGEPAEAPFFPVTREVISRVIHDIAAEDPPGFMIHESAIIQQDLE